MSDTPTALNNPPAFPTQQLDTRRSMTDQGIVVYETIPGMTLLDWMASENMKVLMQGNVESTVLWKFTPKDIADQSYAVAKAMLEERTKHIQQ